MAKWLFGFVVRHIPIIVRVVSQISPKRASGQEDWSWKTQGIKPSARVQSHGAFTAEDLCITATARELQLQLTKSWAYTTLVSSTDLVPGFSLVQNTDDARN